MDDKEFGYMRAVVEQNTKDIQRVITMLERQAVKEEEVTDGINTRLQELQDQLNIYKTIINVIKLLGASCVLILTLKFGDITNLWK